MNGAFPTELGCVGVQVTGPGLAQPVADPVCQSDSDQCADARIYRYGTSNSRFLNPGSANGVISAVGTLNSLQAFAPAFFLFANSMSIAAEEAVTGKIVADPGVVPGASPAKPGDIVSLFGTGFGDTNPAVAAGQLATGIEISQIRHGDDRHDDARIRPMFSTPAFRPDRSADFINSMCEFPLRRPAGDVPVTISIGGIETQAGATFPYSSSVETDSRPIRCTIAVWLDAISNSMKDLLEVLKPGSKDWILANSIDPSRLPAHIAIIMDGNGRWARRRNLPRVAGHKAGMEPVRNTVETCTRLGIQALTLYAFSAENWKRPRAEVDMLWRLLRLYLSRELPELLRNGIRFTCMGRMDQLPAPVRQELETAIEATAHNTGMRLNVAINYSGRAELVDAVNAIIEDARLEGRLRELRIDEQAIASRLYTAGLPDPDLLIRTSGEMRISNFLLWQIAYAELYVTETLWPDFRRADLLHAILDYQKRDRRFGGLGLRPAHRPRVG